MNETRYRRLGQLADRVNEHGDTRCLASAEQAEYDELGDEYDQERMAPMQCPASFLGGDDDGRIGIRSDADMGL